MSEKYALDILSDISSLGAKTLCFRIEQNHQLWKPKGPVMIQLDSYRRLVGHLIYLTITHPDLAYSMQVHSQFMNQPRQAHWDAALSVLLYIKSTPSQEFLLYAVFDLVLRAYCDLD